MYVELEKAASELGKITKTDTPTEEHASIKYLCVCI